MKWSPLNKTNGRKTALTHSPTPATLATQLRPYLFAALGVLTATVIETTFIDIFERAVLFGYWPVVILSGWIGGLWPGLFATVLSVAAANYYILPTRFSSAEKADDFLILAMFAAIAIFMSWIRQREQRSQETLYYQQREMQITLASIGDGVIVIDAQGQVTFINPVAAALTGWTPAEAIGRDIGKVFDIVNEDTLQPTSIPVVEAIERGIVIGLANHTMLRSKNGQSWPISDTGAPIRDVNGEIIGAVLVFRDMSESRSRERALEASEARYRQIVDNATDIIYTLDLEGRITSINPIAEQITGYSQEELLRMSLADLIAPEDLSKSETMRDRKLTGEDKTVYELDVITKDQQRRTLEINSRLSGDTQPPSGIEGIARDISSRKETDQRVRTLHDISAALAKAITLQEVVSVVIDHVLKVLGAHHGAVGLVSKDKQHLELLRLTNLTQEDFQRYQSTPLHVSGPLTDAIRQGAPIWIESQPEYFELYPHYKELIQNVTKTQAAVALPLRIRAEAIGGLMVSFPQPRKLSSEDQSFLETIADYCAQSIERAQLYEAESLGRRMLENHQQWLENIIDTVPGIIWENQHRDDQEEMKLVFISAYVQTMLGYTVEEALNEPRFWFKIFHPEDAEATASAFYKVRQSGSSGVVNFRAVHKNGSIIDIQALMTTILAEGKPVGKRGVMMDVSERQRLLKDQERYVTMLRRSNDELRQFAYVASHDLQEPLRMVASFMQLIETRYADKLDDDAREFIGYAVTGATHMKELINALLAYSRVDRGDQNFEEFNAQVALDSALNTLSLQIADSGAVITHDELPRIKADQVQITQLFQNLVGNALKFRGQTPPEIHIGVERLSREWQFSVRDNGIGIAADSLERIFVIFQRLHTRDVYPGTGIGLAISKKVIERHGGRIWVESKLGEGATFYFTLPA